MTEYQPYPDSKDHRIKIDQTLIWHEYLIDVDKGLSKKKCIVMNPFVDVGP